MVTIVSFEQKFAKESINENGFLIDKAMKESKHMASNTRFKYKYCNITMLKSIVMIYNKFN